MHAPALEDLRAALGDSIREAVRALYGIELARVLLERPPRVELGDLASPVAFDLARSARKAPRAIAAEIAGALVLPPGVASARVEGGGYVNFRLARAPFAAALAAVTPAPAAARPGKVVVEHTNINPNKAAHIGHLRNAVLGDVLVRALRFLGHEVEVQNYLDDTGVQVADVVAGLMRLENVTTLEAARRSIEESRLPSGASSTKGFAYLCWDLYAEVGRTYAARPETKAWRTETLHAIEDGGNETARIAAAVSEAVAHAHLATMGRLGIAYDLLPRESDILRKRFWTRAFELLKGSGAVVLENEGQACRLLGPAPRRIGRVRGDGGAGQDPRALERHRDLHGQGHRVPALEVRPARRGLRLRALHAPAGAPGPSRPTRSRPPCGRTRSGEPPTPPGRPAPPPSAARRASTTSSTSARPIRRRSCARACASSGSTPRRIAPSTSPTRSWRSRPGPPGSSPPGSGRSTASPPRTRRSPSSRCRGARGSASRPTTWSRSCSNARGARSSSRREEGGAAAEQDARAIAIGALRYFLLKFGRNKVIAFDFDEAVNFEGDTGPYLQYSLVRADNIFRKLAERGLPTEPSVEALAGAEWEEDLWALLLDAAADGRGGREGRRGARALDARAPRLRPRPGVQSVLPPPSDRRRGGSRHPESPPRRRAYFSAGDGTIARAAGNPRAGEDVTSRNQDSGFRIQGTIAPPDS